jgi:hypothetical protein
MTLAIHLAWSPVGRSWVSGVHVAVTVLLELLDTAGWGLVLARNLRARLVTNWWKLDLSTSRLLVAWRRLVAVVGVLSIGWVGLDLGGTGTVILGLALCVFLLLACLPFLSYLFELCREAKLVSGSYCEVVKVT